MSTILSELAQLAVALTSLPLPTNDNMHFTNTDNPIDFPPCGCYSCMSKIKDANGISPTSYTFIVCPDCGNKRCPKSTDHNLECTNSNDTGQKGSRYE